jgi:hypothetical protein
MPAIESLIEQHHRVMFRDNVQMVAQQTRNPLRGAVTEAPASGEAMSAADLVGTVEAMEDDGRNRRNEENRPANTRRWLIRPNRIKSGQYIDTPEKLDKAMDPTSVYVRTHTTAVQRAIADRIMGIKREGGEFVLREGGILGAATEGKNRQSKIQLPSKCFTPANSEGLTLGKLKAGVERLQTDEFGVEDDDTIYCAITPRQKTNLLDLADGNGESLNAFAQMQLMNGKPTSLLGITWIMTNRLFRTAGGVRYCPMWTRRNIVMGVWMDVAGDIWNDTHADNTPYARVQAYVDVVRIEDDGVQVIECDES